MRRKRTVKDVINRQRSTGAELLGNDQVQPPQPPIVQPDAGNQTVPPTAYYQPTPQLIQPPPAVPPTFPNPAGQPVAANQVPGVQPVVPIQAPPTLFPPQAPASQTVLAQPAVPVEPIQDVSLEQNNSAAPAPLPNQPVLTNQDVTAGPVVEPEGSQTPVAALSGNQVSKEQKKEEEQTPSQAIKQVPQESKAKKNAKRTSQKKKNASRATGKNSGAGTKKNPTSKKSATASKSLTSREGPDSEQSPAKNSSAKRDAPSQPAKRSKRTPDQESKPRAAGFHWRVQPSDAEETTDGTRQAVARSAPAWLISLVGHMLLLLLIGVLTVPQLISEVVSIDVVFAEDLGMQLDDDSMTFDLLDAEVPELVELTEVPPVVLPAVAPPLDPTLAGTAPASEVETPTVGVALSGRKDGMKKALLGKYGGTNSTEEAVQRGLEWLARFQHHDGSWSLMGPYSDPGTVENKTAATAMALLAFQGAGNTHKKGEFQKNVERGWKALLKMQNAEGDFYVGEVPNQHLYSHGQATIAVCELYGMSRDPAFREPAQRAVDFAVKAQSPEGGWRYYPGRDSDTSVTGWYVMGLQSALMAGLKVPEETLQRIHSFLDTVQREDGARYIYQPNQKVSPTMTAEALLCRQYLGWSRDDPRLVSGVEYVLENAIDWDEDQNVYYWYYAAQLTHHMEGEYWDRWNQVMRDVIPKNQDLSRRELGSWSPVEDRWGGLGGRLYTTCMCIYMLEVYYRHLPIYS